MIERISIKTEFKGNDAQIDDSNARVDTEEFTDTVTGIESTSDFTDGYTADEDSNADEHSDTDENSSADEHSRIAYIKLEHDGKNLTFINMDGL